MISAISSTSRIVTLIALCMSTIQVAATPLSQVIGNSFKSGYQTVEKALISADNYLTEKSKLINEKFPKHVLSGLVGGAVLAVTGATLYKGYRLIKQYRADQKPHEVLVYETEILLGDLNTEYEMVFSLNLCLQPSFSYCLNPSEQLLAMQSLKQCVAAHNSSKYPFLAFCWKLDTSLNKCRSASEAIERRINVLTSKVAKNPRMQQHKEHCIQELYYLYDRLAIVDSNLTELQNSVAALYEYKTEGALWTIENRP